MNILEIFKDNLTKLFKSIQEDINNAVEAKVNEKLANVTATSVTSTATEDNKLILDFEAKKPKDWDSSWQRVWDGYVKIEYQLPQGWTKENTIGYANITADNKIVLQVRPETSQRIVLEKINPAKIVKAIGYESENNFKKPPSAANFVAGVLTSAVRNSKDTVVLNFNVNFDENKYYIYIKEHGGWDVEPLETWHYSAQGKKVEVSGGDWKSVRNEKPQLVTQIFEKNGWKKVGEMLVENKF